MIPAKDRCGCAGLLRLKLRLASLATPKGLKEAVCVDTLLPTLLFESIGVVENVASPLHLAVAVADAQEVSVVVLCQLFSQVVQHDGPSIGISVPLL